jgi:SAM-dependent methyltransferase
VTTVPLEVVSSVKVGEGFPMGSGFAEAGTITSPLARRLASGVTLGDSPAVVDVRRSVPSNPPEAVQVQFVGASFEKAYAEAEAFVEAVVEQLSACGHPGLVEGRVLDLGSGWGRISRVLLTAVAPDRLFAVDVDPEMTALVNVSLPGINAITVAPAPPTVLATGSMDLAVAFSVFSHLSAAAHEAWAHELARLLRPGGVAAVTVLGEDFIDLVERAGQAVELGDENSFNTSMARVIDDPVAARAGFRSDQVQFWPTGAAASGPATTTAGRRPPAGASSGSGATPASRSCTGGRAASCSPRRSPCASGATPAR